MRLSSHCKYLLSAAILYLASVQTFVVLHAEEPNQSQQFRDVIAPIFAAQCLQCHGAEKQEGGYSIRTPSEMRQAGDSDRPPFAGTDLAASELWRRISTADADERMPPDSEPLTEEQLSAIRTWIVAGTPLAKADEDLTLAELAMQKHAVAPEKYPRPIPVHTIAPLRDGKEVLVAGYAEVTRWNAVDGALIGRIPVAGTQVVALALTADEQLLAISSGVAGQRGSVELVAITEPQKRLKLSSTEDIAPDIAFSPDGRKLIIGGQNGSLQIVSIKADPLAVASSETLTPHADSILAVAWSGNGKQYLTASRDRTAKLFDATKNELIASIDRHERAVGGAGFASDRPLSLDETGRLRVMVGDDSDRTLTELSRLPRVLQRFAFEDSLIVIPAGNAFRQFNLKQERVDDGKDDKGKPKQKSVTRLVESKQLAAPPEQWITSVAIRGPVIAAGTQQGEVLVWNRESGELLHSFLAKP